MPLVEVEVVGIFLSGELVLVAKEMVVFKPQTHKLSFPVVVLEFLEDLHHSRLSSAAFTPAGDRRLVVMSGRVLTC